MKIHFHGAARSVTGSRHLLEVNGYKILLDCGLYQGRRKDTYERNQNLPFNAESVDILILSHAHIDHSGNIPNLVKNGFKGDIICTYATRDLCAVMLRDSAKIQQYDIEYVNKKRKKKNLPPLEPIYTMEDAVNSLNFFVGLGYARTREIIPGVKLTFYDAGHIMGSAIVALDIEENGKSTRLVFSGDLGRPNVPILCDPTFIDEADVLLIESTYGDREHKEEAEVTSRLENIINTTYKRGGKLIVPAFAVGRTQELVYRIHKLSISNKIPSDLLIFVDSPLAINATDIFRLHPETYDKETANFILEGKHSDLFGFNKIRYTRAVSQSKEINEIKDPTIIISASGMAEAGRILHHLKNNIEDSRNTILIVGWQAPHTLGRRIVDKEPQVKIFGEEYDLKAEVLKLNGMSGHADRSMLLKWVNSFKKKPEHVFVIHGEEEVSLKFAETLKEQGLSNVKVPELGETCVI